MPDSAINSILNDLQEWLQSHKGCTVAPGLCYIEVAALDSFDVMELVTFTEDHFGFQFRTEDFADTRFLTLDGLASLIHSRQPLS